MSYKLSFIFIISFFIPVAYSHENQFEKTDDIIVTADKILGHDSKSTTESTQISGTLINETNSSSIDEILLHNSDINLVHNGPIGSSSAAFLRGADSSHTLVILDGIILNDPTNPNRQFDFSNLSTLNIDKIEILKGSQGLLYGTNAIGGVIVITSKIAGKENDLLNKLNFSYGTYSTYSTNLSTQFSQSDQHVILGLDYLTSKGFSAANDPTHPNDRDGTKNLNTDIGVNGTINSSSNYELKARIQTATADLDKGGGPFSDDPNYQSKSQEIYSKLELNHIWSELIQSKFYYTYAEHFRRTFDSIDPYQTYDGSSYSRGNIQSLNLENTIIYSDIFTQDLNIGLDQESDTVHENSHAHMFLYNKIEKPNTIFDFGARIDSNKLFHDFFTYKIGIAKKFELFSFHSNYSTGFQTPSLNQLFDKTHGNPNLIPEKSNSIDLEVDFIGTKFNSSTSFFYTYLKDRLSYEPINLNNVNAGRAMMKGIEQEFLINLNSNLSNQLLLNYIDAKNLSNGQKLARRPEYAATNKIRLKNDNLMVNFEYKFVGKRNDVDNLGNPTSDSPYSLFNLIFEYDFNKKNKGYLKIQNLLNSNYEEIWGYNTGGRICTLGLNIKF